MKYRASGGWPSGSLQPADLLSQIHSAESNAPSSHLTAQNGLAGICQAADRRVLSIPCEFNHRV